MRRNVIDRLALLCTLHADGPRTLRLLREAGCNSIQMLGDLSAKKVGQVLGLPAAAARRLIREATRLHERLEPDLEQEELTYPAAAELQGRKPPPPNYRFEETCSERSTGAPALGLRDQELMQLVLERWNGEQPAATDPEPEALEQRVLEPQARAAGPRSVELDDHERRALSTEESELERALPVLLQPGDLDGLDASICAALAGAEVRSLEELATCPADELTVRSGLPFTLARTLQFRAGKHLASQGPSGQPQLPFEAPGATGVQERLSPSERPNEQPSEETDPRDKAPELGGPDWDDSGAAGPFA